MSKTRTLPSTRRSLPIALMRAREKVMAPIREMLADSGLTEQQWRVLRVLAEHGALDSSTLADRASLLLPSLTRIIGALSQAGYVTRVVDEEDRRRHVVEITGAGRGLIDANSGRAREIADGFVETLGQEKFDALLDMLEELSEG